MLAIPNRPTLLQLCQINSIVTLNQTILNSIKYLYWFIRFAIDLVGLGVGTLPLMQCQLLVAASGTLPRTSQQF